MRLIDIMKRLLPQSWHGPMIISQGRNKINLIFRDFDGRVTKVQITWVTWDDPTPEGERIDRFLSGNGGE